MTDIDSPAPRKPYVAPELVVLVTRETHGGIVNAAAENTMLNTKPLAIPTS